MIKLEGVGVTRSGTTILHDVELAVSASEVVGITGPNGTGKTTLLRVVATLLIPTVGTATVLDATVGSPQARRVRPAIGLVGHQPALSPNLTLREQLAFHAALAGIEPERVDRALKAVGLHGAGDRRASAVSAGMARRADLARVVMTKPTLLLLDEPDASLDSDATEVIDALIGSVTGRGGAVLMVSHDPERVEHRCDRAIRLVDGTLEAA